MRLTKDLNTPHDDTTYSDIVKNAIDRENICLTKLKHYEDIEEELGIDLITLFKALKNGVFVKPWHTIRKRKMSLREYDGKLVLFDDYENDYQLKDYGKTWALTEEELL